MKKYNLPLFSVLLLFDWSLAAEFSPVIETTKGPVKGLVLTSSRESKKYHSYRGIPYGKPPVGYLRFRVSISQLREQRKKRDMTFIVKENFF